MDRPVRRGESHRLGHSWDSDDLFVIHTGEPCEDIRLLQENDRSPHAPTARELAQKKSWSYTRIPEMESRIAQAPRLGRPECPGVAGVVPRTLPWPGPARAHRRDAAGSGAHG
jgi:hypothetical protein